MKTTNNITNSDSTRFTLRPQRFAGATALVFCLLIQPALAQNRDALDRSVEENAADPIGDSGASNGSVNGVDAAATGDAAQETPPEEAYAHIGLLPGDPDPNGLNGFSDSDYGNLLELPGERSGTAKSFAGAYAFSSQATIGNNVALTDAQSIEFTNSANRFRGIAGFNQEGGSATSQANVVAFSNAAGGGAFAIVNTEQMLANNQVRSRAASLTTAIENSFNDSSGIVGINQSAGGLNQQVNATAIAYAFEEGGDAPFSALGDAELSSISTNDANQLSEDPEQLRENRIEGSFNNFSGVAQVSQVAGSLNQVSNKIGIAVTSHGGL